MERATVHKQSYRDFEAYRLARHLLVDPLVSEASSEDQRPADDPLSRTALSVAMSLADSAACQDAAIRRDHLLASLEATGQLEQLILDGRHSGRLEAGTAERLLELQRRAVDSLRASLAG